MKTRIEKLQAGEIKPGSPRTEKEKDVEELEGKKEELKNKEEVLNQLPQKREQAKEGFEFQIRGEEIQKKFLQLQIKDPRILNPNFFCEQNPGWMEVRTEELEYRLELKNKNIAFIKKDLEKTLKAMFASETQLKQACEKLKRKIKGLSEKKS